MKLFRVVFHEERKERKCAFGFDESDEVNEVMGSFFEEAKMCLTRGLLSSCQAVFAGKDTRRFTSLKSMSHP